MVHAATLALTACLTRPGQLWQWVKSLGECQSPDCQDRDRDFWDRELVDHDGPAYGRHTAAAMTFSIPRLNGPVHRFSR